MIEITSFTIASDFQSLDITIDADTGNTVDELLFYVGSNYLSSTPVDLSSRLSGIQVETLNITKEELGVTDDYLDGIFTAEAENSLAESVEASLLNSYFVSLCIARKIATEDTQDSFQEIEVLYFLLEATKTYIDSGFTEQALNVFERVQAMCENYEDYMVITDLPAATVGSGAWIINGKYVIH